MLGCLSCSKQLRYHQKKYCSNACQKEFEYEKYIKKWKAGEAHGSRGLQAKNISGHLIRYLHEKYHNACTLCGWNEVNVSTGRTPLEIDHIDGNANNNTESNLRLLCPNCHSLTPNYRNLNMGHGRLWRREKYVKIIKVPL